MIDGSKVDRDAIERRTQEIGRALYEAAAGYRRGPADAAQDAVTLLIARSPAFRTALLRYVDALAALDFDRDGRLTARLARAYLGRQLEDEPRLVGAPLRAALGPWMPARVIRRVSLLATRAVAAQFIVAGDPAGVLDRLRDAGRFPSFDILGEHVVSDEEARAYTDRYLSLLDRLSRRPEAGARTAGGALQLQVSVKLSALVAHYNPIDVVGTVRRLEGPLFAILERARDGGVGVTVDAEEYELHELTCAALAAACGPGRPFASFRDAGCVLQAYLVDAPEQARRIVALARERGTPLHVRLVKGAYWDEENVVAGEMGWPSPVLKRKWQTDAQFEALTEVLLAAGDHVRLAVGSHNLRAHAHAEAVREQRGLPAGRVEHQTLHGMAPAISEALARMGWPARDYVPTGALVPGMAYLVRRVLENSSQSGFLLQRRLGADVDALLRPPDAHARLGAAPAHAVARGLAPHHGQKGGDAPPQHEGAAGVAAERPGRRPLDAQEAPPDFRNQPPARLFLSPARDAFRASLEEAQRAKGARYPLRLGDEVVDTGAWLRSLDPSDPDEGRPVAVMAAAGPDEAARAIAIANGGFAVWSARGVEERAQILLRAADLLADERDRHAAWVVLESAKNWPGALADVDEAIDYLRYYALEARRLAPSWAGRLAPRGVVAAIPPWNFPIAIPCGMAAGALAAGNAVILKPAEETPLIGHLLIDVLHRAGVPPDAAICLQGDGPTIGAALVESPDVDMVVFTGSREVGASIHAEAARVRTTRGGSKRVVAEMGGKNPIVVFADADLDEAAAGILASAFSQSGQKCSACSRVLIQRPIYKRLLDRLASGAASLPVGAATDSGVVISPLISADAVRRVRSRAEVARREGTVVLDAVEQPGCRGYNLGPLIVELRYEQLFSALTAQEEIFGPILAVAPFDTEEQAIRAANGTAYALTAGVYSRDPRTIGAAAASLRAGNVYVNRPIIGARVGVEPFGGMDMSGTGPKAGGPDYLWAFVAPRFSGAGSSGGQVGTTAASVPFPPVRPWSATLPDRRAILDRAIGQLDAPARGRAREVLARAPELLPVATLALPGQRTWEDRATPRGVALVAAGQGSELATLWAMVVACLLAGNGVAVLALGPSPVSSDLDLFWDAGVPRAALSAWALDHLPAADAAGELPETVTFAVSDLQPDEERRLAAALARRRPGQRTLRELFSVRAGLAPGEPGFLRQLVLPKVVAVRTLRHGAELDFGASAFAPTGAVGVR